MSKNPTIKVMMGKRYYINILCPITVEKGKISFGESLIGGLKLFLKKLMTSVKMIIFMILM